MNSREGGARPGTGSGATARTGDTNHLQDHDQHDPRFHDHRPSRDQRVQPRKRCAGYIHLAAIAVATTGGSLFVIGGMVAGASGLNAVLLAAAVPLAGMVWAIVLSRSSP